jgi:hypothetical protein
LTDQLADASDLTASCAHLVLVDELLEAVEGELGVIQTIK